MRAELLQLAAELSRKGEAYVLAMVVRRESFSSAHQGDMAIITADGGYHGWLGGNCTRPLVRKEAARALLDGKPRLVSISPEPDLTPREGVIALPMTCMSGGTVEIYLEPMLPPPRLLIFGPSPVAHALEQLGRAMGYAIASAENAQGAYAIVATMGENDEESIAEALKAQPIYLAVVASRKRFADIRESLKARGISEEAIAKIRNPAGLDLHAKLPEEVALSILAQIVEEKNARAAPAPVVEREEIDPVCGMSVVVATAKHRGEALGREWFFCNPRCKEKFLADPQRFLQKAGA